MYLDDDADALWSTGHPWIYFIVKVYNDKHWYIFEK